MKTYKYTISFNALREFEINANSPEEANKMLEIKVERLTEAVYGSINLDSPHGYVIPKECEDGFPYEH